MFAHKTSVDFVRQLVHNRFNYKNKNKNKNKNKHKNKHKNNNKIYNTYCALHEQGYTTDNFVHKTLAH